MKQEADLEKRTTKCLNWREKQALPDIFSAKEDLKSQKQNKAVSQTLTPSAAPNVSAIILLFSGS